MAMLSHFCRVETRNVVAWLQNRVENERVVPAARLRLLLLGWYRHTGCEMFCWYSIVCTCVR